MKVKVDQGAGTPVKSAEERDFERFAMPPDPIRFSGPIRVGEDLFELIHPPEERLRGIEKLCGEATRELRVVLYMLEADHCGSRVIDAMAAAAGRGVHVRVLLDGFGCANLPEEALEGLRAAGAEVSRFNARRSLQYLVRNHQKLFVADESAALLPGFNATDDYFGCRGQTSWEDMGVLLGGPVVAKLARYCDDLFALALGQRVRFQALRRLVHRWKRVPGAVCLLLGGPVRRLSPWARSFRHDLRAARRVDIVAAYFSPSSSITRAIARVARRGRARLILPSKTDNVATIGASRFLYARLLRSGVRILEFQPCALHMKLYVIDDVVYVGSANLDPRSLFINLEIELRIESAELAARMRELIDWMEERSEEQTSTLHARRATLFARVRWALAYFATAVVDYTVARKANFGIRA